MASPTRIDRPAGRRARLAGAFAAVAATAVLAGCGGGGGDGGVSPFPPPGPPPVSAQQCSANNPYRNDATQTTFLGDLGTEKTWLRSYVDQAYLWYNEVPNVNANLPAYSVDTPSGFYGSIDNYFNALLTPALTPSGKRKDEFSFTYPTRAWRELSQSGTSLSHGIEWYFASRTPPRGLRIAFVDPVSPAATAGLRRGDVLVSVNGVSADVATQAGVNTLNAALFPSTASASSFVFDRGGQTVNATLTATTVARDPVPTVPSRVLNFGANNRVGYIAFHDHIATSEAKLIAAINEINSQGPVNDLVLDLRYNGGGYLFIASELAYMIAGPSRTYVGADSKTFEKLQYNSKRTADNAAPPTPFYNTSCLIDASFNCTSQQPLPTLNLSRVYVLTSRNTCSASEAIVNALRGVDVDVRLIGPGATCGKPYGFTAKDNCGISYFPIEFKGVNAKGFGDYADGFAPTCTANDDFSKALGDPAEGQLAAALFHRTNGACPTTAAPIGLSKASVGTAEGFLARPPVRENRVVVPLNR